MAESSESTSDIISLPVTEAKEVEIDTSQNNRLIPGRSKAADAVCLESGCGFRCSRIPGLRKHLQTVHGFAQPKSTFRFRLEEDFFEWLSRIEDKNHCSYMRRRGWQTNKNESKTTSYYCHRGGLYISSASKKQTKQQGTCKTGVECTSSLKVTSWPMHNNLIEVEAYLEHYGHSFELGHTRIHWRDRKEIELKLKSGMSRHKILDEIRGSLDQSTGLSRVHLVSLQDIYNIEKKCGIRASRGRYCSESGITAQAWIEGMQHSEDNPVLLIKYQQESATEKYSNLREDDFLLILQTPLQSKMLQKHGPRQFMCVDATNGSPSAADVNVKDNHAFQLFALEVLIPDENHNKESYPVAWCVSNRKDGEVLRIFFECIKENLHGFTLTPGYLFVPPVGVSGGHDWFQIWCSTFGAGPRKLLSSWHVLDEWKSVLQSKCAATFHLDSERSRVITNFETVLRETSGYHFIKLINECLADLKSNYMTEPLASYFESNYMSQAELWASAYRTDAANSADSILDIFHSRFSKHIYHEALKRKQLDILVKTLMKYTRDNVLMKLRNLHKGKNEFHHRTVTGVIHNESMALSLGSVSAVKGKTNQWTVTAFTHSVDEQISQIKKVSVNLTVTIKTERCCTARLRCSLRCSDCSACSHQMTCSCNIDNEEEIKTSAQPMCVHMHQVCRYLIKEHNESVNDFITPPLLLRSQPVEALPLTVLTKPIVQPCVKPESDSVTDIIITMENYDDAISGSLEEDNKSNDKETQQDSEIINKQVNEQPKCLGSASTKLLTLSVLRDRDESEGPCKKIMDINNARKVIKLESNSKTYIVPSKFITKIINK
ncbi:uncharacterized protein LOC120326329 [Styela clava]